MRQTIDEGLVVIQKDEFEGLRVRMLSDRDAGHVVWEATLLNEAGEVTETFTRVLKPVELHFLPELVEMLEHATELLTPRLRPDRANVKEPGSS